MSVVDDIAGVSSILCTIAANIKRIKMHNRLKFALISIFTDEFKILIHETNHTDSKALFIPQLNRALEFF